MKYYTNHCWCSDSKWGGMYDCRFILTIDKQIDEEFDEMVTKVEYHSEEEAKLLERYYSKFEVVPLKEKEIHKMAIRNSHRLNKEVEQYLEENVIDRMDEEGVLERGWAIGSDEYNHASYTGTFDIFFHRRRDLLSFIRKYSKYGVPTEYFDYFRDYRKRLDIETLEYEIDV